MAAYRERLVQHMRAAKARPCSDCGVQYHFAAMEFDHVRGVKRFNLATSCAGSKSIATIDAEIAKCEVVCANCHRVRTWTAIWAKRKGARRQKGL